MSADTQRCGRCSAVALATAALLLFSALPGQGKGYEVHNWHVEAGLPSARVTAIAQTPDDYLWVGTPRGLARFDGVRFKVFTAETSPGLGDSRIVSLHTDRQGTLWVGTLDGNVVRWQDGRFQPVSPPVPLPVDADKLRMPDIEPRDTASRDKESVLISDGDGALWWSMPGKGVARLKVGTWTVFTQSNGLPNAAGPLACASEGRIWVASGVKYLHCFDGSQWEPAAQAVRLKGRALPTLAPAVGGGLWVADQYAWSSWNTGRVCRLAGWQPDRPAQFTNYWTIPPRTEVTALREDRNRRLWAGTRNGLFYFDDGGQWCKLEVEGPTPLELARVTCLLEGPPGNLWVGTLHDGLFRVTPRPVTTFALPTPGLAVRCLCVARDDVLWVGTAEKGVFRFDAGGFTPVGGEWGADAPEIQGLFEDSRTNLWAGTTVGLFRLGQGLFRRVGTPSELSRNAQVIFEDRTGRVWFGSVGAVACLHAGEFTAIPLPQRTEDVRAFAEDGAGDLWMGTLRHGLFRLRHGENQTVQHAGDYTERDARALFCDRAGILWVGGDQSGLFRRSADGFQQFSSADGFPSDTIYSIVSDRNGNLWMGSGNGIIGISQQAITAYVAGASPPLPWKHLSLAQGLHTPRCYSRSQPGANATSDGRLWFPNEDRLAALDTARLFQDSIRTVLIESVLADGRELPSAPGEVLRASSGTRRFEFQYTALDLTSPSSLRFRYKLEGMDSSWVEAGRSRTAQYSQLPPGDYAFHVMASGGDGQWREAGGKIRLKVIPRVWERRWAQLLSVGLLVGLGSGIAARAHRRRLRLRLARLEMEQKVEDERRRIARDLHDELGSRLTAIANLGELAVNRNLSPAEMKSQVAASNTRVRDLIGAMDRVVWTVDPANDSLPNLAAFVSDYTENFVRPTGISQRLELDPEFPRVPVTSQSRHHLLLAVKEALSNAVRHAAPRTIRLKIHARDGWLEVVVADDGSGFQPDQGRAGGHGLANMAERMSLAGGRAEIRSEPGKGTTVTFLMPLDAPTGHD